MNIRKIIIFTYFIPSEEPTKAKQAVEVFTFIVILFKNNGKIIIDLPNQITKRERNEGWFKKNCSQQLPPAWNRTRQAKSSTFNTMLVTIYITEPSECRLALMQYIPIFQHKNPYKKFKRGKHKKQRNVTATVLVVNKLALKNTKKIIIFLPQANSTRPGKVRIETSCRKLS